MTTKVLALLKATRTAMLMPGELSRLLSATPGIMPAATPGRRRRSCLEPGRVTPVGRRARGGI
eukprot:12393403-Alexandrium_andersonii.AAC.1